MLNKAGKSKKLLYKEKSQPPPTRRGKKGGSQTTKMQPTWLKNAYQINKLNYLQSRPQKARSGTHHTSQTSRMTSTITINHTMQKKVHWHTIEFSDIITTTTTRSLLSSPSLSKRLGITYSPIQSMSNPWRKIHPNHNLVNLTANSLRPGLI